MVFAGTMYKLSRPSLNFINNIICQTRCKASRNIMTTTFSVRPIINSSKYKQTSLRAFAVPINSSRRLLPSVLNRNCLHTEGDKELVHFLKEEITYEKENVMEEPKFPDFEVNISGTNVSLIKDFHGERVEVIFDINENINVDEGVLDNEDASMEEAINQPDIVSYPQFSVNITKPSGRTLQFSCTCNNIGDEVEGEDGAQDQEEQVDLFRFDSLKIFEGTQSPEGCYDAETENMDGELYSNLMGTLLERGITGTVVNDLVDLSTTIEHKQYLRFLCDLQSFADEK